ncbi:hypothetical protein LTR78_010415 [Recurvomyces mirabilis]|uniref:Uncharacterized protein n=1 Tax=Recurvomyces mirabilis TaxID=574656 RepID=A0AAE0TQ60_9PEZI|nr:hypothetical protein LTR78_010415 [Recurvomyces mirabilis]KAK4551735.1 hypothetical protein LTR86_010928 [Recurvomyces mirabilis]KAK5149750.1 hypothetical protein LTS14_010671 [Recurvomyces mirabilis]
MGPTHPVLAQSESKGRFFERLGLDKDNASARDTYAKMKQEAIDARVRLTAALANAGVEPPYDHSQISEATLQSEIQNIYQCAAPETRALYVLGHDRDQTPPGNWVIRWMLWHAFRYRDGRNRNRKVNKASNGDKGDKGDTEASAHGPSVGLICRFQHQLET